MEPTIRSGRHLAENADISGSRFHDVDMSGAGFDDVNLAGASFHNVNMSDIRVSAAQIGGACFGCVGTPPDAEGRQARQRPVTFENAMLCDSLFRHVDLSGSRIEECDLTGVTIDGVALADLLEAWRALNR